MMETPVVFKAENENIASCPKGSEKCCFIDTENGNLERGQEIKNVTISSDSFADDITDKHSIFNGDCGNIIITICQFINCSTSSDFGGGLLIEQDCHVVIHHTIFDSCVTEKHGAGAAIAKKLSVGVDGDQHPTDPKHEYALKIDIQYTCFQNCYTRSNYSFGSAIIMGAQEITLFYASTVNCPGHLGQTWGAQFDIMANQTINSKLVNATGGHSIFCGSIEYREAKSGFFKFQTITQMDCMYATSFTSVSIEGLSISTCNVHNNTLRTNNIDNVHSPCLVFVREKNISIENFYFFDNDFGEKGVFASRNHQDDIYITLFNCFSDENSESRWKDERNIVYNCSFEDELKETLHLTLLNLGECAGEATPGQMVVTSYFTPSKAFSPSSAYTKSDEFSKSKHFTETGKFTKSDVFTQSAVFSNSFDFTQSKFPFNDRGLGSEGGNKNTGMIAGVSVAAVAIIALAAFFLWKKTHLNIDENSADIAGGQETVVSVDNNLNTVMQEDDPFAGDFTNIDINEN